MTAALEWRSSGDGSPSLWSAHFGQGFHCRSGALQEARLKVVRPAQLERFSAGTTLTVVETCVGLGYNTAALIEAAADRQLQLRWWGLELDPRPLALALGSPAFRGLWRPDTLKRLEQLRDRGQWRGGNGEQGHWWLGDARHHLPKLEQELGGRCALVVHDAFSPGCCPELWTLEFLGGLGALLAANGRLLTYSAAAAVRRSLQLAGLELASLVACGTGNDAPGPLARLWSAGTAASPTPLASAEGLLQPLSPMEREHMSTRAAEPYRDPDGRSSAATIQAVRALAQARSTATSTSAWRRRWQLEERPAQAR